MVWLHYFAYFFGGIFLCNGVPHFVSGVMGRPFQSPFAKPPGQGLSSSTINILWGFFNFLISYLLIARTGNFDFRAWGQFVSFGGGILVMGILCSRLFGRFHGGDFTKIS